MSTNEGRPSTKEINHTLKEIQNGNHTVLEDLFNKYPSLPWTQLYYKKTGDTILHCASRLGLVNSIEYLLERSDYQSIDCKNLDDKTALHEAAQFSQYQVCERLLQHGANVNALKRADWTPLMLACTKIAGINSLKTVELLLENGAIVNYKNKDGWTALHLVSREGDIGILKALLRDGADARMKTRNGRTALHIAALHGNIEIVKILLDLGLNVDEIDQCGNTALHEAVLGNSIEVCTTLIDKNAQVGIKNKRGYSILHLAASQGHLEVTDFILTNLPWDINEITMDGFTALHCATRNGHVETFNYLIDKGADVTIRDNFDRSPRSYLSP